MVKTSIKNPFVYPNERHRHYSSSDFLLSQLLKDKGHKTDLFDTIL